MFTAPFWHLKTTLCRFNRRQDVEGMWATTFPSWDVVSLVWCIWKKKMTVCMCRVCPVRVCVCVCVSQHFHCQLSAVPICSSHGASWTCSAINQSPAMAECLQTHTYPLIWVHTNLWQTSVQRKPRPPATLLNGYSCCVRGHSAKKNFSPRFNIDNRSCCFVIFSVSLLVILCW